jgi:hypothetical protein
MIEVKTMHKKDALIAIPPPFDAMELRHYSNSAINAYAATAHLFGKPAITVPTAASTGSGCGLPRAIPFGSLASFLAIALLPSTALRTIG